MILSEYPSQPYEEPATYLLELRILATVLDTGEVPDLEVSDFQIPDFAAVWGIILRFEREHGRPDYVLIGDYMIRTADVDKREWLADVRSHRMENPKFLDEYVEALKSHRDKETVTEKLKQAAVEAKQSPDGLDARDQAIATLRNIAVRKRRELSTASSLVLPTIEEMDRLVRLREDPGIGTGIPTLDKKLGGWQKGDLVLLAARPGVGKTVLACNFALAAKGRHVGFVSAEQPAGQIMHRMLSILSRIQAWKFRAPKQLDEHEWKTLLPPAVTELKSRNITFLDDPAPSIADIESAFRDSNIDLLIVDYAQRLSAKGEIYERVSSIVRGLKSLARNFNIPVIALTQINRQGTKNAGLEHLKGSGDLEQEADQVLILEREKGDETMEKHGIYPATLLVEKNRHGRTGEIGLTFNATILEFRETQR